MASRSESFWMWQPLLQIAPSGGSVADAQLVARIADALWGLGLEPAEVERIGQALMAKLYKTRQREEWNLARVSIWVRMPAVSDTKGPARTCPAVQSVRTCTRGGWGFFVLEGDEGRPHQTRGRSDRVIELYLYQEG